MSYSRQVVNLSTPLVLDTYSFECGGREFTQVKSIERFPYRVSHYNGSSEYEHCIDALKYKLSNLFYKNQLTFNFDTFSTKLKSTFDTIEKYGEGKYEIDKVSTFLENIRTTNQNL